MCTCKKVKCLEIIIKFRIAVVSVMDSGEGWEKGRDRKDK